jgi:hypothetical protein
VSTPTTPESAIEARASESKLHRVRETQPAAHPLSLLSDLGEKFLPAALRAELRLIPVLPDQAEPPATIGASFGHGTHSAKGLPKRETPQDGNIDVGGAGACTRPAEHYVFAMLATNVLNGPSI